MLTGIVGVGAARHPLRGPHGETRSQLGSLSWLGELDG
jgi:hypothetical protein